MILVTVEISTDRSEEYMLLFSLNTLFILTKEMDILKPSNEEPNHPSDEI